MAKKKKAAAAAKGGAKKKAKAPSKGKGRAYGSKRQAQPLLIPPDAANYPKYKVLFEGKDGESKVCEGPHTESLTITTPDVKLKLTVENEETTTLNGPNLKITIVHD
jgi:hypothetical protein